MDTVSPREADLLSRYIEPNPSRPGVEDARLADYGVPLWALVGHYHAIGEDVAQVARDYELPEGAVEAALVYYRCGCKSGA